MAAGARAAPPPPPPACLAARAGAAAAPQGEGPLAPACVPAPSRPAPAALGEPRGSRCFYSVPAPRAGRPEAMERAFTPLDCLLPAGTVPPAGGGARVQGNSPLAGRGPPPSLRRGSRAGGYASRPGAAAPRSRRAPPRACLVLKHCGTNRVTAPPSTPARPLLLREGPAVPLGQR